MNFDWRTDEEESWTPQPEPPSPPSNRRRRRLLALFIALAAIVLVMAYVYRQAQQRIAATEEAVAGDVLASHELVATAARTGDAEMLRNVLSGSDDEWAAAQIRRIADAPHAGLLAFGLEPLAGQESPPDVELNPEMRAAELTWVAGYVVTDSAGITQTVSLTQTAVYRRGRNNWLLAPPEPAFWQGSDEFRGDYLEAIYPGRDEAIATRLARGLDATLAAICRGGCPAGYRLRLILSPDPASFADTAPRALLAAGRTIVLPTPTLVGLPVDDAAYAALERGYTLLMTTAVLVDLAGYDCCHNALYAGAWVHWYQHLRGLRAWPLDAAAYEAMLLNMPSTEELTGFLGANPGLLPELSFEQWGPVYAFVQFLYERFGPGAVSAPLHAPPGNALRDLGIEEEDWAEAWPQFVYEKSLSGSLSASPVPLPAADLALQCTEGEELVGLRQMDVTTGQSQSLYANVPLSGVNWPDQVYYEPFGPGKGLLLLSRRAITGTGRARAFEFAVRLVRAQDGSTTTLLRERAPTWDELASFSVAGADPARRFLVFVQVRRGSDGGSRPDFYLVDLRLCHENGCAIREIAGEVFWSPGGSHSLILSPPRQDDVGRNVGPELYEGDGDAGIQRRVDWASHVAWLDGTHYAYVSAPPAERDLVVRAVGQEAELLRLPFSDLWTLAGVAEAMPRGYALTDHALRANPQNPRRLLVSAGMGPFGGQGESRLLLVEFAEGWQEVGWATSLAVDAGLFELSGTGRWLAVVTTEDSRHNRFSLLDLEAPEEPARQLPRDESVAGGLWAPEGDWLVLRGGPSLLLHNPTAGYTHFLPLEGGDCYAYGWVE